MSEPGFDAALKAAIQLLRYGDKFEVEVRRALANRGLPTAAIDRAVEHLVGRNILSDERAIETYLCKRSGPKAVGRLRLEAELIERGAPAELVSSVLAERDEIEDARAVLDKRFGNSFESGKAARFLVSRGFSEETIRTIVDVDD